MARRIASLLRAAPAALRATDPALEANAYAVAEDVDLTVVLQGAAVELAVAASEGRPTQVAGVSLPPAASGQDLRGLIESGVRVVAHGRDVDEHGIDRAALVPGVEVVETRTVATILSDAEGVLTW